MKAKILINPIRWNEDRLLIISYQQGSQYITFFFAQFYGKIDVEINILP